MTAASRSTRGTAAVLEDSESLTVRDRLIFAQAVFEFGAKDWSKVVDILSKHPFISRPGNFFNNQSCPIIYSHLLHEAELEWSEAGESRKALINRKLAEKYYRVHMRELHEKINSEETRFKNLVKEIDEIRSGAWDEKIRAKLNGVKLDAESSQPEVEAEEDEGEQGEQEEQEEQEEPDTQLPADIAEETTSLPAENSPSPSVPLETEVKLTVENNHEDAAFEKSREHDVQTEPSELDEPLSPVVDERPTKAHSEGSEKERKAQEDQREGTVDVDMKDESEEPPPATTRTSGRRRKSTAAGRTPQRVTEIASSSKNVIREKPTSKSSRKSSVRSAHSEKPDDMLEEKDAMQVEEEMSVVNEDVDAPDNVDDGSSRSAHEESGENMSRASTSRTRSPEARSVRDGKRRASDATGTSSDSSRDKKKLRSDSEPMDEDEALTPSALPERRTDKPSVAERRRFQNVINMLHSQISQHRNGTIFHNPIKPSEAPDYHDIIKRPMDLKTIKARVRDGLVNNSLEYQRDIYLMFANSLMYNRPTSDIYRMAEEMMLESEEYINNFRQTEGIARIRI